MGKDFEGKKKNCLNKGIEEKKQRQGEKAG
jgi:hypothetical protein